MKIEITIVGHPGTANMMALQLVKDYDDWDPTITSVDDGDDAGQTRRYKITLTRREES